MEDNLNMTLRELLPLMQQRIMQSTSYFGIKTLKSPIDFWVYKEIIYSSKPDVIIEIGNFCGGSLLAMAHFLDSMNNGRMIGVDISHKNVPQIVRDHPRITLVEGDACKVFETVKSIINEKETVLVIEDSSHTYENTISVLETYSVLVKPNGFFIVEDGICYHGLDLGPKPGPYEAIEDFVQHNNNFIVDRNFESFLVTWNPKGYLRRIL